MNAMELLNVLSQYSEEELKEMDVYLKTNGFEITVLKPPLVDFEGDLIFEYDL